MLLSGGALMPHAGDSGFNPQHHKKGSLMIKTNSS